MAVATRTLSHALKWPPKQLQVGETVQVFEALVTASASGVVHFARVPHGAVMTEVKVYRKGTTGDIEVGDASDSDRYAVSISAGSTTFNDAAGLGHQIIVTDEQINRWAYLNLYASSAAISESMKFLIRFVMDSPA